MVFDLDGTLADTGADLLAAANACFRAMGHGDLLRHPDDALIAFHGGRAMLKAGLARAGVEDEALVDAQFPRLLEAYAAAIDTHTVMYPGAVQALERLRAAGIAVTMLTNKPEGLAEALCARLGIRHHFAALVGADSLPVRKPEPAAYAAAVTRAGGTVGRSVIVGDTETDLKAGRAVGAPVILVAFGPEGPGIARLAPDALLHHFDDLPALVDRLLDGRAAGQASVTAVPEAETIIIDSPDPTAP